MMSMADAVEAASERGVAVCPNCKLGFRSPEPDPVYWWRSWRIAPRCKHCAEPLVLPNYRRAVAS